MGIHAISWLRLKLRSLSAFQYPILMFLLVRFVLTALGIALFLMGLVPLSADPVTRPYFGVAPVVDGLEGLLLGVWQRFDVIHFQRIAATGYGDDALAAFFPLFPLIMRAVGFLFSGNTLLGGMLVSNASCLLFLITLYAWLGEEGYEEDVRRRTLLYLLVFPTAFFLLVPYSESLFLLLTVVALREARRKRWVAASLAAFGAALTRVTGICLLPVLAVEVLRQNKWSLSAARWKLLYAFSPLLSCGGLYLWQRWCHFPSTVELQWTFWCRYVSFPWQGLVLTMERILRGTAFAIEVVDLIVVLLMLVLGVLVLRRLPLIHGVYFWSLLLSGLCQTRMGQPLSGQARYALALLPAFLLLALLVRSDRWNRVVVYPAMLVSLLLAGQFVLWGWVG